MPTPEGQRILTDLEPLFEQAAREGKWFFCSYQQLWFSPIELRVEHRKNSFLWGAVNWKLRDPQEYLQQLEQEVEKAQFTLTRARARVEANRNANVPTKS